jgi:Acetyltransferase (GNAT) domain
VSELSKTVSAGYEIVKYSPAHKPLVAELQKQMWSSDGDLNARYLEWKYEQNLRAGGASIYLALHGDRLVGMRGFHPARLEAGNPSRAFPVLIAGDAVIAPGHRDRSLVTRIMNMAQADLADRDARFLRSAGGVLFPI